MYPKICSIGPFTIHSYGVLIAIGVFLSIFLMGRLARRLGFSPDGQIFDLVFIIVLSGFAGARIFYIIQEWGWYRNHPFEIIQIWKGGLVYYGGMVASFLGFFIYVRLKGLPFLKSADFMMPFIALTHAFGRVGCFLNGCCFGKDHHPTQLYEAAFNLGLFLILIRTYARRQFDGQIVALYLIFYAVGRFVIEFFRGDQLPWLGPFTFHQILSFIFLFMGAMVYGICRKRN